VAGRPEAGPSHSPLHWCRVEPFTEDQAKEVGELLRRVRFDDIVDASVVVSAAHRGDSVVTSDPTHIAMLAAAWRAEIDIVAV
jgi:hypothetical protein